MTRTDQIYGTSLQLLTDFYELTMAYGYWKTGRHELPAVFTMHFRTNPFGGGYAVAAGLENIARVMEQFRFSGEVLGGRIAGSKTLWREPWRASP